MARHGTATLHLLAFLSLTGPGLAEGSRGQGGGLTSAAIDYSLFRDGEVRRVEKRFESWLLTCDLVPRLGQKFCSLRSIARSADGTTIAAVTVSTDDRGRPAAILTLPFGTELRSGLTLARASAAGPARDRAKGDDRTLHPAQCGGLGCQVLWPMEARDIAGLRAGHPLRLTFRLVAGRPSLAAYVSPLPTTLVEGRLDTAGFSDALDASMH